MKPQEKEQEADVSKPELEEEKSDVFKPQNKEELADEKAVLKFATAPDDECSVETQVRLRPFF